MKKNGCEWTIGRAGVIEKGRVVVGLGVWWRFARAVEKAAHCSLRSLATFLYGDPALRGE